MFADEIGLKFLDGFGVDFVSVHLGGSPSAHFGIGWVVDCFEEANSLCRIGSP